MAGISRFAISPLAGMLIIALTACGSIVPDGEFIREELGQRVREEVSKRADQLADHIEELEEGSPLPEQSTGGTDNPRGSSAAPAGDVEAANGGSEARQVTTLAVLASDAAAVGNIGPWMTAFDAVEIALESSSGVAIEVSGNVALARGDTEVGDFQAVVPSPGSGYGLEWWVRLQDGERAVGCTVISAQVSCDSFVHPPSSGDMAGVAEDSTSVFSVLEGDSRWIDLVANENVTVLFSLHPDISQQGQFIWSAFVTVHDAEVVPSTGNFHWQIESGALEAWVN